MKKWIFLFFFLFPLHLLAEVPVQEGMSSNINPEEDQQQKAALAKQLKETTRLITYLNLKINNTQKALAQEKEKMNQLVQEENQLTCKLAKERALLKKQVMLSYRISDTSLFHALLSQKNLYEEEKAYTYTKHLHRAQISLAQKISQTLETLSQTKQQRQAQITLLEKRYADQKRAQASLEETL